MNEQNTADTSTNFRELKTNNHYSEMLGMIDSKDIHEAITEMIDHLVKQGAPLPCERNMLIDLTTNGVMQSMRSVSDNIAQVVTLTESDPKKGLIYGTVITKVLVLMLGTLQDMISNHARENILRSMLGGLGIDPAMADAMVQDGVHKG